VSANARTLSRSRDRTINSLSDLDLIWIQRIQLPFHPAARIPRWELPEVALTRVWRPISSSSNRIKLSKRRVFNSRIITEAACPVSHLSHSRDSVANARVNSINSATCSSRFSRNQEHGCRKSGDFYQARIPGFFNASRGSKGSRFKSNSLRRYRRF